MATSTSSHHDLTSLPNRSGSFPAPSWAAGFEPTPDPSIFERFAALQADNRRLRKRRRLVRSSLLAVAVVALLLVAGALLPDQRPVVEMESAARPGSDVGPAAEPPGPVTDVAPRTDVAPAAATCDEASLQDALRVSHGSGYVLSGEARCSGRFASALVRRDLEFGFEEVLAVFRAGETGWETAVVVIPFDCRRAMASELEFSDSLCDP